MNKHYAGLTTRMLSEIETISDRMTHQGEKGRNNEHVLAAFLNEHLPKRYWISTGKVIAADGRESGQVDLIVHDRITTPAFVEARAWSLVPVESVYAVLSVKTTLNKEELRDSLESISKVRALPRTAAIRYDSNHMVSLREDETLRPRGFVFAFKSSWATPESAEKAFQDLLSEFDDSLRPNAVCALDQCLIIRRAYTTETILFKEHALMHFVVFLVQTMDKFPRYQVDLKKYFREDYGDNSGKKA
jgi:hypothetical protein